MNLDLEIEFSKAPILQEIDALKKQIDEMRPLPADIEGRVMQKLRLDWNYNSNAIEGNKLSYGETVAFLMEGITAKGKPLKDHLDIRGHNEAILFLTDLVKDARGISEADIRALHKMILVEPYKVEAQTEDGKPTTKTIKLGEYKSMSNHVQTATGETHYYTTPEEVPAKMQELIEWYKEANSYENIHPVVVAALFHHKFVAIHPFDDGNGRLSRILMNLILMQKGLPPAVIRMDDRKNYYSLLSRADNNENWPFVDYIAERLDISLKLYLMAADGGDINEEDDIDKEIALFKLELQKEILLSEKKSETLIKRVFEKNIKDLVVKIFNKAKEFNDFFTSSYHYLEYDIIDQVGNSQFQDHSFHENNFRQFAELEFVDCISVKIISSYHDFKNNVSFSISIILKITFNNYTFSISDQSEKEIVNKFYNEELSVIEQQLIIKSFTQAIQNNIKKNIG